MDTLNQFLQPSTSPIFSQPSFVPGMDFAMQYQVQARFLRATQTNLKNFIQLSGSASVTGTFGNGALLYLQTTLTPVPPHQNDQNFALPYVALYQGTTATGTGQIYPQLGAGIGTDIYRIYGGLDFQNFNGTNSVWSGVIHNVAGGNVTILFATRWRYVYYNQGSIV